MLDRARSTCARPPCMCTPPQAASVMAVYGQVVKVLEDLFHVLLRYRTVSASGHGGGGTSASARLYRRLQVTLGC